MEELAKIAEIISGLGEQGKTAFIAWLVADTLQQLVWAAVVGACGWALFRRIGQALANLVKAQCDE